MVIDITKCTNGGKIKMNRIFSYRKIFLVIIIIIFPVFLISQNIPKFYRNETLFFANFENQFLMSYTSDVNKDSTINIDISKMDMNDTQQIITIFTEKNHEAFNLKLSIGNLSQLQINFIYQSIDKIGHNFYENAFNKLEISDCVLDSLPYNFMFSDVSEIYFQNTEIKKIRRLSGNDLITLNILDSFVNSFPENFEKQANIFNISMSFSKDTTYSKIRTKKEFHELDLYKEFYKFNRNKNLRRLYVKGFEFKKFPDYLIDFQVLNNLFIECKSLNKLPESLKKREQYLDLNVSKTGVTEFPDWVTELDYELYLTTNKQQSELNESKYKKNMLLYYLFKFGPKKE